MALNRKYRYRVKNKLVDYCVLYNNNLHKWQIYNCKRGNNIWENGDIPEWPEYHIVEESFTYRPDISIIGFNDYVKIIFK